MDVDNGQLGDADEDDDDEVMLLQIPPSPPRGVTTSKAEMVAAAQPADSILGSVLSGVVGNGRLPAIIGERDKTSRHPSSKSEWDHLAKMAEETATNRLWMAVHTLQSTVCPILQLV
jgi:hypothetical protein